MIAIVETATGTVEAIVESLDGVDMAGRHSIALPEGYDPIAVSHVLVDGEWQPNVDAAWARLRAERHAKLRACDWTVLPDVPEPTRLAWLTYRQALRDLPEITLDPVAPIWPTPRSEEHTSEPPSLMPNSYAVF